MSTQESCLRSLPLRTDRLPTGRREILRELIVCADGTDWVIPTGTKTDFSSIPAIGRSLVRWSRVDIAGVVHDWLYLTGQVSRARADRVWRLVAQKGQHSANSFQAWIAWMALRGYGGIAWAGHRRTLRAWVFALIQVAISSAIIFAPIAQLLLLGLEVI